MKKSGVFAITITTLIIVIALVTTYYYLQINGNSAENDVKKTEEQKSAVCGDITADGNVTKGKAPFSPVLRGKLSGSYNPNGQICQWSIDGALSHNTYPVKGECLFGGRKLMTKGTHVVSYKISESNCTKSINIVVE